MATWHNQPAMSLKLNGFWSTAAVIAVAAGLSAQAPAPAPPGNQQNPNFRVQIFLAQRNSAPLKLLLEQLSMDHGLQNFFSVTIDAGFR